MRRRTLLIALLGLLILGLAACGGDEAETVSLSFEGTDQFEFTPAAATVPAGSEVTVTFTNEGALEHSWALIPNSVDPTEATEADAFAGADSGTVAGGESTTFTFTAPDEPGTYQFVCIVPGHAAGGMVGTLTVSSG